MTSKPALMQGMPVAHPIGQIRRPPAVCSALYSLPRSPRSQSPACHSTDSRTASRGTGSHGLYYVGIFSCLIVRDGCRLMILWFFCSGFFTTYCFSHCPQGPVSSGRLLGVPRPREPRHQRSKARFSLFAQARREPRVLQAVVVWEAEVHVEGARPKGGKVSLRVT
jgi:hypothetical protein